MTLEIDTNSDEKISVRSQMEDFIVGVFKKFDSITFNQEKSSFIIQNISILLTIKTLECKKDFFKELFANSWKSPDDISKEEQFANFQANLVNFVKSFIDPTYSSNDIAYHIALNEDNFSSLNSIMESFNEEFPKDYNKLDDSIIELFLDTYWSYFKPKKDFLVLNLSNNTSKFLLLNSLQKDLENMLLLFSALNNESDSEEVNQFSDIILNYRVIDPLTLTGSLLIEAYTLLTKFYVNLLAMCKQDLNEKSFLPGLMLKIFGKQSFETNIDEIRSLILLRHLFGIVPDKDLLLLNKLNLYIAMNDLSDVQKPIRTNMYFNIIKGNILLGFENKQALEKLDILLEEDLYQEIKKDLGGLQELHKEFILNLESFEKIRSVKEKISNLLRDEYLKNIADLKIKSDLQERLAIVNPYIDFIFLRDASENYFSVVIGLIPNKLRLTITNSKILINQFYEKPEDVINVINLYCNRFLNLAGENGSIAVFVNRNILYHGEYTKFREKILQTTALHLVLDLGDYKYQRTKNGLALIITKIRPNSLDNTFKGLNILSLEQDQKEQLLVEYKDDHPPADTVISRNITQKEILEIQGSRFFIKKPSKWFDKFSIVPNTLHEYIESIDGGLKVGENKVLYLAEHKVKELQLEESTLKYALKGRHFNRYSIPENHSLLIIPPEIPEEQIQTDYPNTWKYLLDQKQLLEIRPQVKKGLIKWFQIADVEKVTEKTVKPPKLLLREKANQPIAVFDTKGTLQVSSTVALRFNKQIRFRDYFKVVAWINSLVVKAGYHDLTQDSNVDAKLSMDSLHDLTIPVALLKDDMLASNVQQIVQMCLANKFSFNPHLLLLEYPEGEFHPEIYKFLFDKIYAVLKKKMKNLLDKTIKIEDIAIIEVNQPNKKKKVDETYLYPIFQDYKKSLLVLKDGELEITMKLKPRQAYTLPFLQLFLAYQPKEMIGDYLRQYTKPESLEVIIGNWPIPELQMKHVMETYNFVRFQRQNFVNFFNRTKKMLTKVETMIATHYGFTPEEIVELLQDRELIES